MAVTYQPCVVCDGDKLRDRRHSHFCSTYCEKWVIDGYRTFVLRDLATSMNGRRIKLRGEQVYAWD